MKQNQPLILIVEDDESIALLTQLYLEKAGFQVAIATDGKQGLQKFIQLAPSLVLLDLMIPEMDGYSLCSEIRLYGSTPIIMLTAKTQTIDKVTGLEFGADDYIGKPFDPPELVARVRAVLRRSEQKAHLLLRFEHLVIDLTAYTVQLDGKMVDLPPKEIELLYFLASHPNQVFKREHILERVWGEGYEGDFRTVDVHVKRLREKLEQSGRAWSIRTVWGIGYKFAVKEPKQD
ncbi:response regulator transcription factor [Fodinisporobacter ferrooxydans]|uniref:Response regulator transcription factor n=1 Tax=Fodinisporobacter ferrooxydans TaxID=2901836 RepID=A0ABY4CR74_9BACL|nr:response regulator transcription factor [Alicyclobacillaceae bacterium MYW30-H2]